MELGPYRVLLADDFQPDIDSYKYALQMDASHKYECLEARTGREAIDTYMAHQPDCMILDYSFPDMSGIDVLHELRTLTGNDALPILMLTGNGAEGLALKALHDGAQDYAVKSYLMSSALGQIVQNTIVKANIATQLAKQHNELTLKTDALQSSNAQLEHFAAIASHELQGPLRKMGYFTEDIESHLNEAGMDSLLRLRKCAKNLQDYVSGLLRWSSIQTLPQQLSNFSLRSLAQESVSEIDTTPELNDPDRQRIEILGDASIEADALQLRHLIKALIENGLKFSSKASDGRVLVRIVENDSQARFQWPIME